MHDKFVTTDVSVKVMTLTLEDVYCLLEMNTRNRKLNEQHVTDLLHAMNKGDWNFDGSPIRVSADGTLLDGQHRLEAQRRLGRPLQHVVVTGIPETAINSIDTVQRLRTGCDVLTIGGITVSSRVDAMVRRMWLGGAQKSRKLTPSETAAFYRAHRVAIDWSLSAYHTRIKGLRRIHVNALIARASYHHPKGRLESFARIMATGLGGAEHESSAVLRMRDLMMVNSSTRSNRALHGPRTGYLYNLLARSLLYFLQGRLTKHITPVSEDPFPLPEEVDRG